ncbi:MAG TPA: DUF892 family protein [Gemmatimonas sp.]|nr:DUF892 family protein [Gemmatimonas sp.]
MSSTPIDVSLGHTFALAIRDTPMSINPLQEIYEAKLQLILDAEQQALENAPSMMKDVQSEALRQALQTHAEQTRLQVDMLRPLVQENQLMRCTSMHALFQEAHHLLGQIQDQDARDAFVIATAQAIEHQEIAAYGTARAWAMQLGRDQDAAVLEKILNQEKQADALLTQLAERQVNEQAAGGSVRSDRQVPIGAERDMYAQGESQGASTAGRRIDTERSAGG